MKEYLGKNVTLMLCSQCNNNCQHCYVKYKGRFTKEELEILIPKLKDKYRVILNGTEPILFKEYFPFFKMVGEHRILTNGIALLEDKGLFDELHKNDIDSVFLSYHFGIQDEISKIKIKDLDKLIKKLKENDFKVKLMCSLSNDNYKKIEEYCASAYEKNVDKIKFTNFVYQGHARDNFSISKILTQNQIDEVLDKIEDCRKKYSIDELKIERCGTFGAYSKKNNFECLAGKDMVAITPDKKVYDCVFNIDDNTEIGYMNEDGKILIDDDYNYNDKTNCKVLRKYNKIWS